MALDMDLAFGLGLVNFQSSSTNVTFHFIISGRECGSPGEQRSAQDDGV